MSHEKLHSHLSTENVAEFLADREGLAGGARERFRRLLRDYGGFRENFAPRYSRPLILVSLLLALSSLVLDWPARWSDGLVWVGYGLLSAGLLWRLRREENKARYFDRETDWEAYCLFLRPVILSDHPGLLDRNATNDGNKTTESRLRSIPLFRSLVRERGPDFWSSAVMGLWIGMVALLFTRLMVTATNWISSLAFLAGGLWFGLAIWILWRRMIYVVAKSDSRLFDR